MYIKKSIMGRKKLTDEQKQDALERRREYMREYKRRTYKDKKRDLSELNKKYYLVRSKDITLDEVNNFTSCGVEFGKIQVTLNTLFQSHPDDVKEFLESCRRKYMVQE